MNTIEITFAGLKALLRQDPACTVDGLINRFAQLFGRLVPVEYAKIF